MVGAPDLVRAVQRGSKDALEALVRLAGPVAYRLGLLLSQDTSDAEDVKQETLLKVLRYAPSLRNPDAFSSWLYRTTTNAFLMAQRPRRRERHFLSIHDYVERLESDPVPVVDPRPSPETLAMTRSLRRRLFSALSGMRPSYRAVIVLRDLHQMSTRESAVILGITSKNVRTRLHRARRVLRCALDAQDGQPAVNGHFPALGQRTPEGDSQLREE